MLTRLAAEFDAQAFESVLNVALAEAEVLRDFSDREPAGDREHDLAQRRTRLVAQSFGVELGGRRLKHRFGLSPVITW